MLDARKMYDIVCNHRRETQILASIQAVLEWDQQTKMPTCAAEYRAKQISHMAGEVHRRSTDPHLGEQLSELALTDLARDPNSPAGATIRELKHEFEKKSKLPTELVQEIASATAIGQQVWIQAREKDDFASFQEILSRIITLKREEAQAIGGSSHLYDVLLDDYEPGARTEEVGKVLAGLKDDLVPLIARIAESPVNVTDEVLRRNYPRQAQESLARRVTEMIGFDYQSGRMDTAAHPFCTELGPRDCRITTRFLEDFFNSAFFGSLHEAGHGLYEQGLPQNQYGLPPGRYCSLGIHESQSRMWENLVGRSRGFWKHLYGEVQSVFPAALSDVSEEKFYFAVNLVEPSLIRVEADEATYNLHIIVRFELEQDLINDQLSVSDLPGAWNEKYEEYLGIKPDSDRNGVLQDIHWAAGLIGYFSTYSLGNIYGSQLLAAAEAEIGDTQEQFEEGQFEPLLQWLRQNVHQVGFCRRPDDLIQSITGSSIDHRPLMDHLTSKLGQIYQL